MVSSVPGVLQQHYTPWLWCQSLISKSLAVKAFDLFVCTPAQAIPLLVYVACIIPAAAKCLGFGHTTESVCVPTKPVPRGALLTQSFSGGAPIIAICMNQTTQSRIKTFNSYELPTKSYPKQTYPLLPKCSKTFS